MFYVEPRAGTSPIDAGELRRSLSYCPETGQFTRISTKRASDYGVGKVVGSPDGCGYSRVWLAGKLRKAHRLAWLYMTGEWPSGDIDHINGDGLDNRWCNLRAVDHKTNVENQRKARKDNKRGMLGVTWHKSSEQWRARITVNGKQKHLGVFDSAELAHETYLAAKRQVHAGCTI